MTDNLNKAQELINLEVENSISAGNISDGCHTFNELYEHRITNFMLVMSLMDDMFSWKQVPVWISRKHSDGSEYEGWFIAGIHTELGKQITYHLPIEKWNEASKFARILGNAPKWDGHTSEDVLERLKKYI